MALKDVTDLGTAIEEIKRRHSLYITKEKPTLEQFDLSKEQFDTFDSRNDKTNARYIAGGIIFGVLITSTVIVVQANGDLAALIIALPLFGFLGGATYGLICGFILLGLRYLVLRFSSPTYNNIRLYKKAKEEYDFWWARTQELFWLSLSGKRFEQEMAILFSELGYDVGLTPSTGDEGVDIMLNKNNKNIVVQCKAHKKPIGPATIRDLYGTLLHSKADEAILASVSGFTKGTIDFAKDKPITLLSLGEILRMKNGEITLK